MIQKIIYQIKQFNIIRMLIYLVVSVVIISGITCYLFKDVFLFRWIHEESLLPSSRPFKEYSFSVEKAILLEKFDEIPEYINEELIHIHTSARTGRKLRNINGIVVHYVANPKTTAMQNRNFFNLPETEVSSHFIIGLDGEIIQCVPLYERSCASNTRNGDTIAIEVCHPDKTGKFNDETYKSLIKLISWLCDEFGLTEDQIIRHHDITGKICPKYYVDHEDEWIKLKEDVKEVRQNKK